MWGLLVGSLLQLLWLSGVLVMSLPGWEIVGLNGLEMGWCLTGNCTQAPWESSLAYPLFWERACPRTRCEEAEPHVPLHCTIVNMFQTVCFTVYS